MLDLNIAIVAAIGAATNEFANLATTHLPTALDPLSNAP